MGIEETTVEVQIQKNKCNKIAKQRRLQEALAPNQ